MSPSPWDDPVAVYAGQSQDGPFEPVGSGYGTFAVDIADSGFEVVRFVRLVDEGDGPFNAEHAGYDLDAVVNLASGPLDLSDGGAPEEDAGDMGDSDNGDGGGDERWRARSWDCGCRASRTATAGLVKVLAVLMARR